MAKLKVDNPPPNWPAPPAGWTPPAGWKPAPEWGPAPEGWAFWHEERANLRAWAYSFVASVTAALLFCALGAIVARSAVDAVLLGIVVGRGLVVGLVVGAIAHSTTKRWPPGCTWWSRWPPTS